MRYGVCVNAAQCLNAGAALAEPAQAAKVARVSVGGVIAADEERNRGCAVIRQDVGPCAARPTNIEVTDAGVVRQAVGYVDDGRAVYEGIGVGKLEVTGIDGGGADVACGNIYRSGGSGVIKQYIVTVDVTLYFAW